MDEPDEVGYATASELQRLRSFERRLVEAMERDDLAVLATVLTGRSEREFVVYTSDAEVLMERLTAMPREQVKYPIEIHRHDDTEWEYYEAEVAAIS